MSKACKWCGIELFWLEEPKGTWTPYEDEARTEIHDCPKKPAGVPRPPAEPPKKVKVEPLTDKEIIFVRKFIHQQKMLTEGFE